MKSFSATSLVIALCAIALVGCDALISPQHRIESARAELAAGQWGSAAIELRKVVKAEPRNAEAWLLLARLSLDAADVGDAQANLDRAVKFGAKGRKVDALRVRTWLATGQAKALLAAIQHGDIALPEPNRSVALARAYNELGQPDQALAALATVLASHATPTSARLAAAEALNRQGKSDQALAQIDAAMAADPHSSAAPLLRAQILGTQGQFGPAGDAFALSLERMLPSAPLAARAQALAGLTESRLAEGKIDEATKSSATLTKLLPNMPIAQMLAARIELAHGDRLGAITDLERLVANVPSFVEARVLLGAAQLDHGDLEQAQQNLEEALQQAPDNLQARELLASVSLKLNQPQQALAVLTPALGEHSMNAQLYSLIGTAGRRTGNPNAALQALEQAVRAHPADRALKLNLAQAYLGANRPNDALPLLEKTDAQGEDLRRDALLVAALNAAKGPTIAGTTVNELLAAHPHDSGMVDLAATYFASQGELDRARALLRQALADNPRDVPSLLAMARLDLVTGDAAAAQSSLRTALAAQPDNIAVRIVLADVLVTQRSFVQAQQLLENAAGPHAAPQILFALAKVDLESGKLKQANGALDRVIALRPGNAAVVNGAGLLLLQANEYDAALARFRKATELEPGNAVYWLNTGRAQIGLNQSPAARASFEKAAKIKPNWLPAVSALALIDLREKHPDHALERVREFLARQPGDADALALEGEIYSSAGHFKEAEAALAGAQRLRPTASVAVQVFEVRRAAGEPNPEEPLQQWLAQSPNDGAVRMVLASYYLAQHALQPAARQFQVIVRQAPRNVIALNDLAWIYGKLKDPRAQSLAEQAYRLAPGQAAVADTLGWILTAKHDTQRALPLLAQAVKADATDPDMQYHYAYVLVQAGQRAAARAILTKLLAGKRDFESRAVAERLYASLRS